MHILIADDHEMFLSGLRFALLDLDADVKIDLARDYLELLSFVFAETEYDLILTDLAMPGMPWNEAIEQVKNKMPNTPIVVLSAVHDKEIIDKVIKAGVKGFIPKTSSNRIIISAIQKVLAGGVYIPPEMFMSESNEKSETIDISQPFLEKNSVDSGLTPRQKEILSLIGQGKANKIIAHELGLSEGTVKLHVTAILKTLGVSNRTGAIMTAINMGLVKPENMEN